MIPMREIEPHPLSRWDTRGRLFSWRGQLYRGLTPTMAPFYRRLFDEGVIAGLVRRGLLIDSEVTDLQLAGYALVVRHRRLPFVSFPFEWSRDMLRAASALCCELQHVLASRGCALTDFSPNNILFDATRPLFVDLCSIVPAHVASLDRWDGWDVFEAFYLAPLALMDQGLDREARSLLAEFGSAVEGLEAWRRATQGAGRDLPAPRVWLALQPRFVSALKLSGYVEEGRAAFMRWVCRRLQELDRFAATPRRQDPVQLTRPCPFDSVVTAAVDSLAPRTVLLTGASGLALSLPRPERAVIALDPDPETVESCQREAKRLAVNLLTLVGDAGIANATPPHVALRSAFDLSPRLRADLVIDLPCIGRAPGATCRTTVHARALAQLVERWLITDLTWWGVASPATTDTWTRQLEDVLGIVLQRGEVLGDPSSSSVVLCERSRARSAVQR